MIDRVLKRNPEIERFLSDRKVPAFPGEGMRVLSIILRIGVQ